MGLFCSKCRQFYHYSPKMSMLVMAGFLYFYVFHGLPQIQRKKLMDAANAASDKKKKASSSGVGRRAVGIVGLKNFGNTCYFNACIQALSACTMFCAWIERRNMMNDICNNKNHDNTDDNANQLGDNDDSANHLPFPVIAALHEAFTLINAKTSTNDPGLSEMIPAKLIGAFAKHNKDAVKNTRMKRFILNSYEEQDTHEAFNYILETIANECSNMSKMYHSSTNLVLTDAVYEDEADFFSRVAEKETLAFCKLTKKPPSTTRSADQADVDTSTKVDEIECDEEEEPTSSPKPSAEPNFIARRGLRPRRQRNFHFIRSTPGGDTICKGKRTQKDWLGGSIVSRTEIHESDIKEDTLMTQNISFDGTLGVKLVCLACNKQNPTKLDKFNCLTVTIPRDVSLGYPIKLEDLLLYSLRPIQVHDVNCDGCFSKFGKPATSSFVKYTAIGRMPQTLCIHINRSEWTNDGTCVKRNDYVKFPAYLNMSKFKRISDLMNQNPRVHALPTFGDMTSFIGGKPDWERSLNDFDYILKAVICHSGRDADSGHFTTFKQSSTRSASDFGWYYISDSHIFPATIIDVLACKAYMLFYEKKPPSSPSMIDFSLAFR